MNPININDLFQEGFTEELDKIVKSLQTLMGTVTEKIGEVRAAATKLAATPMPTTHTEETRKMATAARALSDEYKSLLQEYGIIAKEVSEVTTVQRDQNQILKLQQQYAEAAEGSFNKLSAEYRLLKVAANALDPSIKENAKNFKYLQERMADLYDTMNKYQQSTGKYSMQVGDYSKALNGLSLSTQQILREMPTLANSTSQFFMAISNNVPIFLDNFKRARMELGSFSAALGGTLRALFSWQTLLLAVLTILPKVAKAIHDKKKAQQEANKEMSEQIDHLKQIHKAMVAAAQAEETSVVKLNLIKAALQDVNRSEEERIKIGGELKELYKEQLANYSAEEIALGKADILINNITASLKRQAQARALVNKLTEAYTARIEVEDKMMSAGQTRLKGGVAGNTTIAALSRYMRETELSASEAKRLLPGITDEILKQVEAYDTARKQVKEYDATIEGLSKKIDVLALFDTDKDGGGRDRKTKEETLGAIPDYIEELYQTIIDGMEDGNEKMILQRELDLMRIEAQYKEDYAKLAELEKQYIAAGNEKAVEEIHRQMRIRAMAYEEALASQPIIADIDLGEGNADPLSLIRGDYLRALQAQSDYTKTIQEGIDEGRRISEEELKIWQGTIRRRLEIEAEYQKAKKQLELQGQLEEGKITPAQYEQMMSIEAEKIEAATRKAIEKIGHKKNKKWNIWTALFGTDVKDETTGTISRVIGEDLRFALDQTMNTYKQATKFIDEYIDALARQAKQAEETANTEVDMARKVYEAELEARANGYANAVDTARMEYEQKLAMQKKAQKESERIQRIQLAMESASQAASLLTATANIIASYSKMPIIGQVLAGAGILAMWGTFIAAKSKAAEVTRYGEGMSEYLDYGGSHASGRDIDFGRAKDGRRRRVERGEVIGVINKRNVRKYGVSTVRGVIDSLNKGTFEYKYGNAFAPALIEGGTKADLHRLENGVDALVRQGEYREMRDGDKRIIQYKNLTRVIR